MENWRCWKIRWSKWRRHLRPTPRSNYELSLGYYRRFGRDYAMVAAPLTDALKSGNSALLSWGPEQEAAYTDLKHYLCAKPVIQLPDIERPFVLWADASGGRVIRKTRLWHISSCFRKPQTDDSGTKLWCRKKECPTIVRAVAKFHRYLYGQFVLQIDHRALMFLDGAKMANARVMRWAVALQAFKFKTESIKESDNVGADYLSRISRAATSRRCVSKIWAAFCQVPCHGVTKFVRGGGSMLRAAS